MNDTPNDLALNAIDKFVSEIAYAPDPTRWAVVLQLAVGHAGPDAFPTRGHMLIRGNKPKCGKGHAHGTGILTPRGFVPVEALKTGDSVIGSAGRATTVTGTYPRGVLPVYRVTFNDGTSVLVDGDHLWSARTHQTKNFRAVETRELARTLHRRWEIPQVSGPVEMPTAELPIDPYILGVLLGDGTVSDHDVRFCTGDAETPAEVADRLPEGYHLSLRGTSFLSLRGTSFAITHGQHGGAPKPNAVLNALRELGLAEKPSHEKFIPSSYLFASVRQRRDLLRGLMDTDGHLYSNGRGTQHTGFASSSEILTDQVRFLVESFGGTAAKRVKHAPKYSYRGETREGRDSYELTINVAIDPFLTREGWGPHPKKTPKRVIRSITQEGEAKVTCIKVAAQDSLYLTEHCIVTHNTTLAADVPMLLANNPWRVGKKTTDPALMHKFLEDIPPDLVADDIGKIYGDAGENGKTSTLYSAMIDGYRNDATVSMSRNGVTRDVPAYCVSWLNGLHKAVPGDLATRCVRGVAVKRPKNVKLRSALHPDTKVEAEGMRTLLHVWVTQHKDEMSYFMLNRAEGLHPKLYDREYQVWGPMAGVAAAAGGEWPRRFMTAFVTLELDATDQPLITPDQQLILDIANVARNYHVQRIFTADLVDQLHDIPERPYSELSDGRLLQLLDGVLGDAMPLHGKTLLGDEASGEGWLTQPVFKQAKAVHDIAYPPMPAPGPTEAERRLMLKMGA